MVPLRIVSLLVPQGTGVCTRPAPLSSEESEGYDDCCAPQRLLDCQGGGSSSSTSTPRLSAARLPCASLGGCSISNTSTPRLSSKLLCARDGETRLTPTPLSRSASSSACRTGVTPVQQGCVTPNARVGRRSSKVCLQEANAGGLPARRDECNGGHSRCQSLGSLGGPNRTAPRRGAGVKSPPWRGGGNNVSSKGAGMPQRAQSQTNLKSMQQQQQQQTVFSGSRERKGLDSAGPAAEKVPGRAGSCPVAPSARESKRHPAAVSQRRSAKRGPAVRRPHQREASTGKAVVDTPLFSVDLWSEAQCEEETEAPSSIRRPSAAADSVVHSEASHGVVDALREVSADDTWVRSFQSTSVRRSMPAEDDTTEGRCSAATARSSSASGSCNTHITPGLQSRLSSTHPSTDSIGRCNALVAMPAEDDTTDERFWAVAAQSCNTHAAMGSQSRLSSTRLSTDSVGQRNALVAMPAEDVRFSRRSWAGAAEHQPQPLPTKDWNQDLAAVAASGGVPSSRSREQIPYPPSGSSWEWPLSRHEKKSRVVMIDRCMLMADHKALARQLQKVRALVS